MIHGLPDKLKELRSQHGFTHRQLANMIGVSPSIISGYETGERTPAQRRSWLFRMFTIAAPIIC
ncbi:MAG: helix-turn-helix transcriptional regulator [Faecousia sp.]